MSLQEKILRLKLEGATAMRHAQWWEKQIATYGVSKVTEFYTSLGLNHLQTKGYEWEGLTLSREPKEHEKLCVKGIAGIVAIRLISPALSSDASPSDWGARRISDNSPSRSMIACSATRCAFTSAPQSSSSAFPAPQTSFPYQGTRAPSPLTLRRSHLRLKHQVLAPAL